MTAGVVEPRYPSFKGIMAAKSKPVDEVKVADLGIDASIVGWAGAGQEIVAVDKAEERQAAGIDLPAEHVEVKLGHEVLVRRAVGVADV